jgi:hypothetical protein
VSDRIPVDPPTSDTRRDRVERAVFAQLQTMRMADRLDAVVPAAARPRRAWLFAGMGALAAATVAVIIFAIRPPAETAVAEHTDTTPSRVVTPVGGTSQFTVGDAVIIATSDTNVEVKRGADGGTTLVVARGSVDCDVPPRGNRPPFHVIAGEVSVEVVGTRFTVTRTPAARVDVARGKVRVKAPGGTWLVAAGESWTPQVTALRTEDPAPAPTPMVEPMIEIDQTPAPAPAPAPVPAPVVAAPSPHVAYQAAVRLASTDPAKAAKAYRAIANGKGADAALALMDLASLVEKTDRDGALAACDEYLRRFAHGANVEDVTWLRIDLLRTAGRRDEARAAAVEYLRQFPNGTFAGDAARMRD